MKCGKAISPEALGCGPAYNCPYLCSTARHSLLTRQLFAASVAPHRSRLYQVIPPERSQSIAAAGRHGINSARSIAFAELAKSPTKTHVETSNSFMLGPSSSSAGKRFAQPSRNSADEADGVGAEGVDGGNDRS